MLLANRSRVQSTTKLNPFELMFGRPMLGFESWNVGFQYMPKKQSPDEKASAVLNRAYEIRRLIQVTVPNKLEDIRKSQRAQMTTQNNRERITEKRLDNDTTVYIRSLKIENKLKPDAHGPYKVVGRTANGNFYLENRLGVRMQQAYPLSRLKTVEPEHPDNHHELERILTTDVEGVSWNTLSSGNTSRIASALG